MHLLYRTRTIVPHRGSRHLAGGKVQVFILMSANTMNPISPLPSATESAIWPGQGYEKGPAAILLERRHIGASNAPARAAVCNPARVAE
jgi:hypothetical protein